MDFIAQTLEFGHPMASHSQVFKSPSFRKRRLLFLYRRKTIKTIKDTIVQYTRIAKMMKKLNLILSKSGFFDKIKPLSMRSGL
jgi:hypothetical protein